MGKYIRKGKITGEIAVMEPSLGVRTRARAKTLALERLQKSTKSRSKPSSCPSSSSPPPPPSSSSSSSSKSSSCYLQLRSRRLEKCFLTKAQKGHNPSANRSSPEGSKRSQGSKKEEAKSENDAASFGENVLDTEVKASRNSRETTPCSLIRRESDIIGTPSSTNRPTSTAASNRRTPTAARRNIPTSREMDEFFSVPERRQQRAFAEKYNFDPAKDRPLPGRYEWVKLDN